MKSQTERRPDNQQPARSNKQKSKKYVKQTAHVEARRDGTPLIFGWGGHLSRNEKTRIQRRLVWAVAVGIGLIILTVIVGFWININVIIPNLAITSVNGQAIPQSDYRKLLVLKSQIALDEMNGAHGLNAQANTLHKQGTDEQKIVDDTNKQITDLNKQIKALPTGSSQLAGLQSQLTTAQAHLNDAQAVLASLGSQYSDLTTNTIPGKQQLFTQSQVGNDSAQWLQEDVLIRNWLAKHSDARASVEPSSGAVNSALKDFKANLPKSTSYNSFLSRNNVSDADMQAMMTLIVRRQNMQTYLASQITSPAYQVKARGMTLSTQKDADDILKQLNSGSDFATLAKSKSQDNNTKANGGDFGWMARGQYTQNYANNISGVIDNWLFDPARTNQELSKVLAENGTYHIVQITGIDPKRVIDSTTLQSLKNNALTAWVWSQRALPGTKITDVNQTMLLDPLNMPPDLPAAAPAAPQQGAPGSVPGGAPSGLPGGTGGVPGQP